MSITEEDFGKTKDGRIIKRFNLQNGHGVCVKILTYGATVQSIETPDKNSHIDDIAAGYSDVKGYEEDSVYFGANIGRVANRIARGKFTLNGQEYSLAVNNGPNHLHGGIESFSKKVWESSVRDSDKLCLRYTSRDGEEGYPGDLTCDIIYQVNEENELMMDYTATTTKPTPVNLSNHSYFNLAGHKHKDIYGHSVMIQADKYTPKTDDGIPTGELDSVTGTPFDLRQPAMMSERLKILNQEGYDINFCLNEQEGKKLSARVEHAGTGRVLEMYTTQPGVQLYTAYYLDGVKGKDGAVYNQYSSLCLESQNYPDAINQPSFPNCVLNPGETYRQTTWYKFTTNKT